MNQLGNASSPHLLTVAVPLHGCKLFLQGGLLWGDGLNWTGLPTGKKLGDTWKPIGDNESQECQLTCIGSIEICGPKFQRKCWMDFPLRYLGPEGLEWDSSYSGVRMTASIITSLNTTWVDTVQGQAMSVAQNPFDLKWKFSLCFEHGHHYIAISTTIALDYTLPFS